MLTDAALGHVEGSRGVGARVVGAKFTAAVGVLTGPVVAHVTRPARLQVPIPLLTGGAEDYDNNDQLLLDVFLKRRRWYKDLQISDSINFTCR